MYQMHVNSSMWVIAVFDKKRGVSLEFIVNINSDGVGVGVISV